MMFVVGLLFEIKRLLSPTSIATPLLWNWEGISRLLCGPELPVSSKVVDCIISFLATILSIIACKSRKLVSKELILCWKLANASAVIGLAGRTNA